MFEDFMKKHEATDRAVFIKPLDSLNKSNYKKLMADVDGVIQTLKRETEEKTQIELDSIKKLQDFMSSPNQHFKSMQETSDKLAQTQKQLEEAEKKLQASEAETKRLLIDQQKSLEEAFERQLQEADAEKKRLLIANKEASDKLIQA